MAAKEAEEFMVEEYGPDWRIPININDFEIPWYKKLLVKFSWWCYYTMPDFIFYPWMEKRARHKMVWYNNRAKRLNEYYGREVLQMLPLDCYKISR